MPVSIARPRNNTNCQGGKRSITMPNQVVVKKSGKWGGARDHLRQVLSECVINFINQDSLTVSGSIAYHGLLTIFPLMLFVLGLSGLVIRHYELTGRLAVVLERFLPMKPDFILRNLVGISQAYGRIGFVSFLLLLWSSSGVFLPLANALNRAWGVQKGRGWLRSHLLALEMTLILGFVVLVSSILVGFNVYVTDWMLRPQLQGAGRLLMTAYHVLIFASTFGLTLAMFLVLFQRLPNRPIDFRQALPSALITAIIWEIARSIFAFLLPIFNYRHVYGSIGAVVALMTWAYISSAVTLFGAQMSHAFYRTTQFPTADSAPASTPVVAHSAREVP